MAENRSRSKARGGLDTLWVALAAGLPAVLALAVFGVIETPDSPGYIDYAAQIHRGLARGGALLAEGPAPVSLFRAPGYPVMLAALQLLFPGDWRRAAVALQIVAQAAVAAGCHRAAIGLGVGRRMAVVAALLPAIGFSVVVQIAILTDALYAAAATGAALLLLRPLVGAAFAAGLLLAGATLLREATPFIALGYLPLALLAAPSPLLARALRVLAVLLPPLAAAGGLAAWNQSRIGLGILTTSRQTVMIQAMLPLVRPGGPIFAGDAPFDRIARETVVPGGYAAIDRFHQRLFDEAGMTAPAIAAAATERYWAAWRGEFWGMLAATAGRFRREFLALPFQPVDTIGALMVYAGWPRPDFNRLDRQWAALGGGGWAMAAVAILATVATRLAGTVLSIAALAAPLRGRRATVGLLAICAGFFAVYLPVHIEPRYLVPVVPLVCLLAAIGLSRHRETRPSSMSRATASADRSAGSP